MQQVSLLLKKEIRRQLRCARVKVGRNFDPEIRQSAGREGGLTYLRKGAIFKQARGGKARG